MPPPAPPTGLPIGLRSLCRPRYARFRRAAALACAALLAVPLSAAAGPRSLWHGGGEVTADPWTLCARHAAEIELRDDLPPHLLLAIAKVESGRWRAGERTSMAWPWTVTAGGAGRHFASKDEAIAAVRALRAEGRRNIDVGCMQVNLRYHPEAFADLETAFDPASNVDYAADLLKRLRQEARSWTKAIAFYHSRTPKFNGPYRLKVFRAWREERHRANRATAALTP